MASALGPSTSLPLVGSESRFEFARLHWPGGRGHIAVVPLRFDCAGVAPPRRAYPRIEATARRTENAKVRNRRLQKKVCFGVPSPSGAQDRRAARAIPSNRHLRWLQFNGTATKPRLSVFCSNRQLYAVLADDHNKKILFYGSTLQKSICGDPPCTTVVGKPSCSSSEIYNPAEKDIIIHTKVLEVATAGLGDTAGSSRFSRRSVGPLSSGVPRGGGAGRGARLLPLMPLQEQLAVVLLLERVLVSWSLAMDKHGGYEDLRGSSRRSIIPYVHGRMELYCCVLVLD
jgi:hypothetical protein